MCIPSFTPSWQKMGYTSDPPLPRKPLLFPRPPLRVHALGRSVARSVCCSALALSLSSAGVCASWRVSRALRAYRLLLARLRFIFFTDTSARTESGWLLADGGDIACLPPPLYAFPRGQTGREDRERRETDKVKEPTDAPLLTAPRRSSPPLTTVCWFALCWFFPSLPAVEF